MLRAFITDDKKQQICSSIFIKVVLFPIETERAMCEIERGAYLIKSCNILQVDVTVLCHNNSL